MQALRVAILTLVAGPASCASLALVTLVSLALVTTRRPFTVRQPVSIPRRLIDRLAFPLPRLACANPDLSTDRDASPQDRRMNIAEIRTKAVELASLAPLATIALSTAGEAQVAALLAAAPAVLVVNQLSVGLSVLRELSNLCKSLLALARWLKGRCRRLQNLWAERATRLEKVLPAAKPRALGGLMVLVVGCPGSGKNSLCMQLEETNGAVAISLRTLVSALMRNKKEAEIRQLADDISSTIMRGDQLPDELVVRALKWHLQCHETAPLHLISGFPSNKAGLDALREVCKQEAITLAGAIILHGGSDHDRSEKGAFFTRLQKRAKADKTVSDSDRAIKQRFDWYARGDGGNMPSGDEFERFLITEHEHGKLDLMRIDTTHTTDETYCEDAKQVKQWLAKLEIADRGFTKPDVEEGLHNRMEVFEEPVQEWRQR